MDAFLFSKKGLLAVLVLLIGMSAGIEYIKNYSIVEKNITTQSSFYNGNTRTELYADLKERLAGVVRTQGSAAAIALLQSESKNDARTLAVCHDLLHEIGRSAFIEGGDMGESMQQKSDFCNSGYIHGLFEAYFQSEDYSMTELKKLCADYSDKGSRFSLWQCHHGIGHGLMYLTSGDLPASLELCSLAVEEQYIVDCQNGIYMEVFNGEFLPLEIQYFIEDDPYKLCNDSPVPAEACYTYAPVYLSENVGMEYTDILTSCDTLDVRYKRYCVLGVFKEATKRNMDAVNDVFSLCGALKKEEDRVLCGSSITGMYLFHTGSIEKGRKFCATVPEAFADVCRATIQNNEAFFKEQP